MSLPLMSLDEVLFRVWIETVKDFAIFGVESDGRVSSWNVGAERILGYSEAEIVGRPFADLFTPEDQDNDVPRQEIEQARAEEHGWDDRWMVRKDQSRFWASGLLTPLRAEDGTPRGFVKVLRDQTERKMLEDELRRRAAELLEADRRKNEFLAMLSHELRNPLAPIFNSLYVLKQSESDDEAVNQSRAMIERQVTHLKRLVDDLMDVARVTSGKVQLRIERVLLGDIVARAIESVSSRVSERQHSLTTVLAPEPIWLDADPTRIEQVVTNLLTNAAKYTEPGGRISLNLQEVDGESEIQVQDNGIGIDPGLLPRLFDLFTQADTSLDRTQGGLGIGLTLTRTLVEMHGGTIVAMSEGLNKGSLFTVRLPLASEPAPVETPARPDAAADRNRRPHRVLVVDDNVDAARSLSLFLKRAGHETVFVHDGVKALEVVESFRPDAVFLDIGLPGMNGYDVARAMRAKTTATLIAMSGYTRDEDAQGHDFDDYLIKPVNPDDLLDMLAGLSL
jgi:PAS domain S-box-containing protein